MKLQIITHHVDECETEARTEFIITMDPNEADCVLHDIQSPYYASTQALQACLIEALKVYPSEYMREQANAK